MTPTLDETKFHHLVEVVTPHLSNVKLCIILGSEEDRGVFWSFLNYDRSFLLMIMFFGVRCSGWVQDS